MGVAFINMRLINVNLSLIWSLNPDSDVELLAGAGRTPHAARL